jgi:hypothetical protein
MPDRTTIVMPPELKARARHCAQREGVSFGEFVRRAVSERIEPAKKHSAKKDRDPFLDNRKVFRDNRPADLIDHLDDFLYGKRA